MLSSQLMQSLLADKKEFTFPFSTFFLTAFKFLSPRCTLLCQIWLILVPGLKMFWRNSKWQSDRVHKPYFCSLGKKNKKKNQKSKHKTRGEASKWLQSINESFTLCDKKIYLSKKCEASAFSQNQFWEKQCVLCRCSKMQEQGEDQCPEVNLGTKSILAARDAAALLTTKHSTGLRCPAHDWCFPEHLQKQEKHSSACALLA